MQSRYAALIVIAVAAINGGAQAKGRPQRNIQESHGACSPNISGSGSQISITCTGIDPVRQQKILALLNEIARQRSTPAQLDAKLDEVLRLLRDAEPRRLAPDQIAILRKSLTVNSPHEVIIRHVTGNLESQALADQLRQLFVESGWTLARTPFRIVEHDAAGVFIGVKNIKQPPKDAVLIQRAFEAVGLNLAGYESEYIADGAVDIYVGLKEKNK